MGHAVYGEDLAAIHEAGFGELARAAARELLGRLPRGARVVDLGCGGGTMAAELTSAGHAVWGVDASPAMVGLARRKAPRARFEVADVLGVRVAPCDAVAMVGEVLGYALADRPLAAADGLFARIHAALSRAGLLLLDVATTGHQADRLARREGPGWAVEADVRVEGDLLTRTIRTWRRRPDGSVAETAESHRERLLDGDWVQERLEAAGFHVERLGAYDDHPLEDGWDAFAATRLG